MLANQFNYSSDDLNQKSKRLLNMNHYNKFNIRTMLGIVNLINSKTIEQRVHFLN